MKEQFGTATPVYNKLFYNSRGQLAEIRASTSYTGPTDYDANRGAIVNSYSDQCTGICSGSSMPDNNGNLKKQDIQIPNQTTRQQQYGYDALNRLLSVRELLSGTEQWKQQYSYDRWGNHRIDTANTYGIGINNLSFEKADALNQLLAPGDTALAETSRRMRYDAAGNQIKDTYTGYGEAKFDGENRITTIQDNHAGWSSYGYDAAGQRIKRTTTGVETWQVYGFGGELVAEYAASGAVGSPQKEYGYRNGQLLVTASPGGNNSLSLNGTTAYVQVPNSSSLNITGAITVEAWVKPNSIGTYQYIASRENYGQAGTGGGYELTMNNLGKIRLDLYQSPTTYTTVFGNTALSTGTWHHVAGVFDGTYMRIYIDGVLDASLSSSSTPASGTSTLKFGRNSGGGYFSGLIDEVRVSNAAVYTSNFTPQTHLTATGSTMGLWKFDGQSTADSSTNGNNGSVQGGASYSTDVPTGPAYHSASFDGLTAYITVPNSSSLNITGAITVEAWIKPTSIGSYQYIASRESYGQSGSGGGYELTLNNLGKARFDLYHSPTTYTPVIGNTGLTTGVWHHVAGVFDGSYLRLYVDGVLDASVTNGSGPASGTSTLKFGRNSGGGYFSGLIDEVRVSNAAVYTSSFTPQTHLTVTGKTMGLWKFDGQTTADASTNGNIGSLQGSATYSNDVPSGDGGGGAGASGPQIQWLIADHLGTPRMVLDQTGDLANMKRHDYLPFGEELFAPTGGRTAAQGYASGDGVRQQFTQKERDVETGLDYFSARYYASMQGRFTGVDPYDINVERQNAADPEETNAMFRNYISEPQHWNHYSYALNNPLKYIDPDGKYEYETELLGKKIKVKISDDIRKKDPEAFNKIKDQIDNAISKINAGKDKLTSDQAKAINSMKGIEIRNDISYSFMNTNNKVFNITQRFAEGGDPDWLTGAIIHDSYHADQARRGVKSSGIEAEKEASRFAADVAARIGLSRATIEALSMDANTGHPQPRTSPYTRPLKKKP